jgi:hypothetical protein
MLTVEAVPPYASAEHMRRCVIEAALTGMIVRFPRTPSTRVFAAPSVDALQGKDVNTVSGADRACRDECLQHLYCVLVKPTDSFVVSDVPAMRHALKEAMANVAGAVSDEASGGGRCSVLMAWRDADSDVGMGVYLHYDDEDQEMCLRSALSSIGVGLLGCSRRGGVASDTHAGTLFDAQDRSQMVSLVLRGRMFFMTDDDVLAVVNAPDVHAPPRLAFKTAVLRLLLNSRSVLPAAPSFDAFVRWVLRTVAVPLIRHMHAAACAVKVASATVCHDEDDTAAAARGLPLPQHGCISFKGALDKQSEDDGVVGFCVYPAGMTRMQAACLMYGDAVLLPSYMTQ